MNRHNGFSLLEVLVAFAILSLSLTIILRVFATGVHATVQSEDYSIAVEIAESLMAGIGVETPLQAGETRGQQSERYKWVIQVQPFQRQQRETHNQQDLTGSPLWQLMRVRVEVAWGDEDRNQQRSLVLQSLKLVAEENPQ